MDPAQLDRFLKIKVSDNTKEWLNYGKRTGISPEILSFIKDNPKCLSNNDKELQDSYKVMGADALLKTMLTPGEYAEYLTKIQEVCGFDTTMQDEVDEAKN